MSLEIEVQKNTDTMAVLIEAINTLAAVVRATTTIYNTGPARPDHVASRPVVAEEKNVDIKEVIIDTVAALKEVARNTVLSETQDKLIAAVEEPEADIDYATVTKAITDVFKVDRAKVIETLEKYGAKKGPQLKAEDYAAFVKDLQS